jgi:hypothetical protein
MLGRSKLKTTAVYMRASICPLKMLHAKFYPARLQRFGITDSSG